MGVLLTLTGPATAAEPVPCLTKGERARFAAAVEALRGGDWQEAARGFAAVVQRGALLADYADFFLVEALARQGDLVAARRAAETLPDRYPDSSLAPLAILRASDLASQQEEEGAT